jgi:hypothetical protein
MKTNRLSELFRYVIDRASHDVVVVRPERPAATQNGVYVKNVEFCAIVVVIQTCRCIIITSHGTS